MNVVISFGSISVGVVGVAVSSSLVGMLMLATGFGIIIGKVVVIVLSLSSRGIIGVSVVADELGSLSVLRIVGSGKGWQRSHMMIRQCIVAFVQSRVRYGGTSDNGLVFTNHITLGLDQDTKVMQGITEVNNLICCNAS